MNKFGYSRLYRDNISVFHKLFFILFGVSPDHRLRYLYLKEAINCIPHDNKIKAILDAGCGTGDYSFYFAERFQNSQIRGIDIDKRVIDSNIKMLEKLQIDNLKFECESIESIKSDKQFDLIFCVDVLEHISNMQDAITKLTTVLSDDGYIYIHLPLKKKKPVIFNKYLTEFHEWEKDEHIGDELSKDELIGMATAQGLEVVQVRETFNHYFGELSVSLVMLFYKNNWTNNIIKAILTPILILLTNIDFVIKNKSGNAVSLFLRKTAHCKCAV